MKRTKGKSKAAPPLVAPFGRSGSWLQSHDRHRRAAALALRQLRHLHAQYHRECDARVAAGENLDQVEQDLAGMHEHCSALATAVEIYSTFNVEGFLNFYGVVRLGEDAYRTEFERVNVISKLTRLLAVCDGVDLDQESDLVQTVRALFGRRNELVHPKASELRGYREDGSPPGPPPPEEDLLELATTAYRRMRTFYRLFSEYALEVDRRGKPRPGIPDPLWWPKLDSEPPAGLRLPLES